MAQFPRSESEVAALALVVIQGLRASVEDFPSPPLAPDDLQAKLDAFNAAKGAAIAAESSAREHSTLKSQALEDLADGLKLELRYVEVTARDQPEKLAKVGWAPRRDPRILIPPGIVRDIGFKAKGETWVLLDWKPPTVGGPPAAYQIECRKAGGDWGHLVTSVDTEELLTGLEPGVELQYRVYAVNRVFVSDVFVLGGYLVFFLVMRENSYASRVEEAMLLRDLPGYRAYTQKTPYRLIPGVW